MDAESIGLVMLLAVELTMRVDGRRQRGLFLETIGRGG